MNIVLRLSGAFVTLAGVVGMLVGQVGGGLFYVILGLALWTAGHLLYARRNGSYRSRLAERVITRVMPSRRRPGAGSAPSGEGLRFTRAPVRPGARARAIAAAELSAALERGWRPEPIPSPIRLHPEERLIATANVSVEQHQGADVDYSSGSLLFVGNPFMTVASVVGSAAWSSRQRRSAQARAKPQWRREDTGVVHFTTDRLALQLSQGWWDLWYSDLRATTGYDNGLELWPASAPPTFLVVDDAPRLLILLRFLAEGEILSVALEPGAREGH